MHFWLLWVSEYSRQFIINFSRLSVLLSVLPLSPHTLVRLQATKIDGYVTFILDMGCQDAPAILQEVWNHNTQQTTHNTTLFSKVSASQIPISPDSRIRSLQCHLRQKSGNRGRDVSGGSVSHTLASVSRKITA